MKLLARAVAGAVLLLAAGAPLAAGAQPPPSPAMPKADPTLPAFKSLYKELVETNTTASVGSCTLAAERMVDTGLYII